MPEYLTPNRHVNLVSARKREDAAARAKMAADKPEADKKFSDKERKTAIVEEALRRFKIAASAETKQRERELEDLKFDRALVEDQWPEAILKARNYSGDQRGVPARPCLVIPKLDQPVQQIINEARQARLGIRVKPKGSGASKDEAELRQGLIRAIESDSNAQVPYMWALDRATKCGRGFFRITKAYANDGDFDLDLIIKAIPNQGSVFYDPFAMELDKSDAEFCFVVDDLPEDEYTRLYPDSALANASAEQLQDLLTRAPGWIDAKSYRVAEYFYVEHQDRDRVFFDPQDGSEPLNGFLDEFPEDLQVILKQAVESKVAKIRKVDDRTIKWCIINAIEVLEENEWEGRYIPIVPAYGKIYNVDGEWIYKGVVSNAKDAQRSYNVMRSAQVEAVGMSPRPRWVAAEGQTEGYEDIWEHANTYPGGYLPYKPTTFEGHLLPPPQQNVAEPPIQAISLAVREADNDIKATTGRHDPSLGNYSSERSGKAIRELKQQAETGSSNYLENFATITLPHAARILNDMLEYVYDTPGRIVRLLGDDPMKEEEVMLGVPFVPDQSGRPMPVPEGQPMPPQAAKHTQPKLLKLTTGGDFLTSVSVGRAQQTQREENVAMLQAMLEAVPPAAPVILPILAKNLEGPAAEELAEALKAMSPGGGEDGAEIPPQFQAMLQQVTQERDIAAQAAREMKQQIDAKTLELQAQQAMKQAELAVKREELASRERIEQFKGQLELAKVGKTTDVKLTETGLKISADLTQQAREIDHEERKQARELAAKQRQAEIGHVHARESAREDVVLSERQAEESHSRSREAAREDAEMQARLEAEQDDDGA